MLSSELDLNSLQGLTRLFWFAVKDREDAASQRVLQKLQRRFDLVIYEPKRRGAFEDALSYLSSLDETHRVETVCGLIAGALRDDEKPIEDLAREILTLTRDKRVVRFSFSASLLICLRHAHAVRKATGRGYPGCDVRFAGLGSERGLLATVSLFLDLPIYTESGPPWAQDMILDDGEPNVELPDFEVSFPPAKFLASDAPELAASIRRWKLPRAIDRGTYDLESVTLSYLCDAEASALAIVSEKFLASTKQSYLATRQRLLELGRLEAVAALELEGDPKYVIRISASGRPAEQVQMISTKDIQRFIGTNLYIGPVRRRANFVSAERIQIAGGFLLPKRFLGDGPVGGAELSKRIINATQPANYVLADLFDIIRPKTIKHDPVGTFTIHEISGKSISRFGEFRSDVRDVCVRSTIRARFEEQQLQPHDVVIAHRGPIGRVAYVSESQIENVDLWAGQTLFIFRERKRYASSPEIPYCDPRVLFMYLLSPRVQESWRTVSSSGRSPSIPIGEVERFALPSSLISNRRSRRESSASTEGSAIESAADKVLSEFRRYQENQKKLREAEENFYKGLSRVFNAAWQV